MSRLHFCENRSRLAIYSLEEKCLDIGPITASLRSTILKLLLELFQPSNYLSTSLLDGCGGCKHIIKPTVGQIFDQSLWSILPKNGMINCPEWNLNLGLSMSNKLNYEAAAFTTQPPWLDSLFSISNYKLVSIYEGVSYCTNGKMNVFLTALHNFVN